MSGNTTADTDAKAAAVPEVQLATAEPDTPVYQTFTAQDNHIFLASLPTGDRNLPRVELATFGSDQNRVFDENTGRWVTTRRDDPTLPDPPESAQEQQFKVLRDAFGLTRGSLADAYRGGFGRQFDQTVVAADRAVDQARTNLADVVRNPEVITAAGRWNTAHANLDRAVQNLNPQELAEFGGNFVQQLDRLTGTERSRAITELNDKLNNTSNPSLKLFLQNTLRFLTVRPPETEQQRTQRASDIGQQLTKGSMTELLQGMQNSPTLESAATRSFNQANTQPLRAAGNRFQDFRDVESTHRAPLDRARTAMEEYNNSVLQSIRLRESYADMLGPIQDQDIRTRAMELLDEAEEKLDQWSGGVFGINPRQWGPFMWRRPTAPPLPPIIREV